MVSLSIDFDLEKYRELIEDFDVWFQQQCKELQLTFCHDNKRYVIEGYQFSLITFYSLLSAKQNISCDDILKEVL
jgi:hypothetical protein